MAYPILFHLPYKLYALLSLACPMPKWYAADENANNLKLECLQDDVSAEKTSGDRRDLKGWKSVF